MDAEMIAGYIARTLLTFALSLDTTRRRGQPCAYSIAIFLRRLAGLSMGILTSGARERIAMPL